ncbi:hypothetical protein Pmani_021499 [Petrolisthes manimaculis]|uniref:C2H2-type domain-containing protein n=1 Tax=Petrolisthes manimaculis TaxID=1843537 RepID=A0AAE1PE33_9EUCA|nr:hypothetical protein Pmani_021499 [Petrolisthes manimaculis]
MKRILPKGVVRVCGGPALPCLLPSQQTTIIFSPPLASPINLGPTQPGSIILPSPPTSTITLSSHNVPQPTPVMLPLTATNLSPAKVQLQSSILPQRRVQPKTDLVDERKSKEVCNNSRAATTSRNSRKKIKSKNSEHNVKSILPKVSQPETKSFVMLSASPVEKLTEATIITHFSLPSQMESISNNSGSERKKKQVTIRNHKIRPKDESIRTLDLESFCTTPNATPVEKASTECEKGKFEIDSNLMPTESITSVSGRGTGNRNVTRNIKQPSSISLGDDVTLNSSLIHSEVPSPADGHFLAQCNVPRPPPPPYPQYSSNFKATADKLTSPSLEEYLDDSSVLCKASTGSEPTQSAISQKKLATTDCHASQSAEESLTKTTRCQINSQSITKTCDRLHPKKQQSLVESSCSLVVSEKNLINVSSPSTLTNKENNLQLALSQVFVDTSSRSDSYPTPTVSINTSLDLASEDKNNLDRSSVGVISSSLCQSPLLNSSTCTKTVAVSPKTVLKSCLMSSETSQNQSLPVVSSSSYPSHQHLSPTRSHGFGTGYCTVPSTHSPDVEVSSPLLSSTPPTSTGYSHSLPSISIAHTVPLSPETSSLVPGSTKYSYASSYSSSVVSELAEHSSQQVSSSEQLKSGYGPTNSHESFSQSLQETLASVLPESDPYIPPVHAIFYSKPQEVQDDHFSHVTLPSQSPHLSSPVAQFSHSNSLTSSHPMQITAHLDSHHSSMYTQPQQPPPYAQSPTQSQLPPSYTQSSTQSQLPPSYTQSPTQSQLLPSYIQSPTQAIQPPSYTLSPTQSQQQPHSYTQSPQSVTHTQSPHPPLYTQSSKLLPPFLQSSQTMSMTQLHQPIMYSQSAQGSTCSYSSGLSTYTQAHHSDSCLQTGNHSPYIGSPQPVAQPLLTQQHSIGEEEPQSPHAISFPASCTPSFCESPQTEAVSHSPRTTLSDAEDFHSKCLFRSNSHSPRYSSCSVPQLLQSQQCLNSPVPYNSHQTDESHDLHYDSTIEDKSFTSTFFTPGDINVSVKSLDKCLSPPSYESYLQCTATGPYISSESNTDNTVPNVASDSNQQAALIDYCPDQNLKQEIGAAVYPLSKKVTGSPPAYPSSLSLLTNHPPPPPKYNFNQQTTLSAHHHHHHPHPHSNIPENTSKSDIPEYYEKDSSHQYFPCTTSPIVTAPLPHSDCTSFHGSSTHGNYSHDVSQALSSSPSGFSHHGGYLPSPSLDPSDNNDTQQQNQDKRLPLNNTQQQNQAKTYFNNIHQQNQDKKFQQQNQDKPYLNNIEQQNHDERFQLDNNIQHQNQNKKFQFGITQQQSKEKRFQVVFGQEVPSLEHHYEEDYLMASWSGSVATRDLVAVQNNDSVRVHSIIERAEKLWFIPSQEQSKVYTKRKEVAKSLLNHPDMHTNRDSMLKEKFWIDEDEPIAEEILVSSLQAAQEEEEQQLRAADEGEGFAAHITHTAAQPKKKTLREMLCQVCGKILKGRKSLICHLNSHHKIQPHSCPRCPRTFTNRSVLAEHYRTHTGEMPFTCSVCDASFRTHSGLVRHKSVHTDARPFECSMCSKAFKTKLHLQQHMKLHLTGLFVCQECGRTFERHKSLAAHRVHHHNKSPKYMCPHCHKGYHYRSLLTYHMQVHSNIRKFVCSDPDCKESFVWRSGWAAHMRTHSNDRPKCNICNKRFASARRLETHSRCHAKSQSHQCKVCGKIFTQAYRLASHSRIHQKKKDYACGKCGMLLTSTKKLKRHLISHRTEKARL